MTFIFEEFGESLIYDNFGYA